MSHDNIPLENRLQKLQTHLDEENDALSSIIPIFRDLDTIAYRLGLLNRNEHSYVTRISWWPIISVLGTFSAGKSSFINRYLGNHLQRTGVQAVDDKFTVICYSGDASTTILPGIALDADDRFPFYAISHEIARLAGTSDQRVDTYLQMKVCASEPLRGKILIDSPGFDADDQRTAILRNITQHIIDLSDLVLIFFDARHAEPGAMRDTLTYLVKATLDRPDSNKLLYILNQIDVTAPADNPEGVVSAWQRSLAQVGLTAGHFYRIYNPDLCVPFDDPQVKERFEKKCAADLDEIHTRIQQVGIDRVYRLTGMLEHTAREIEEKMVPTLQELIQRWKKKVLWTELGTIGILAVLTILWFAMTNTNLDLTKLNDLNPLTLQIMGGVTFLIVLLLHLKVCKQAATSVLKKFKRDKEITDDYTRECVTRAFRKNTCFWRALGIWFINEPRGWCHSTLQRLHKVLSDINNHVQTLNNRFTNPSGKPTDSSPVIQTTAATVPTTTKPASPPSTVAAG